MHKKAGKKPLHVDRSEQFTGEKVEKSTKEKRGTHARVHIYALINACIRNIMCKYAQSLILHLECNHCLYLDHVRLDNGTCSYVCQNVIRDCLDMCEVQTGIRSGFAACATQCIQGSGFDNDGQCSNHCF